jgi:hypothetical protein
VIAKIAQILRIKALKRRQSSRLLPVFAVRLLPTRYSVVDVRIIHCKTKQNARKVSNRLNSSLTLIDGTLHTQEHAIESSVRVTQKKKEEGNGASECSFVCCTMTTKKNPLERFSIEYAHNNSDSGGGGGDIILPHAHFVSSSSFLYSENAAQRSYSFCLCCTEQIISLFLNLYSLL